MELKCLVVLVTSTMSVLAEHACYIKPTDSSVSCPGKPCMSLDEYVKQQAEYFTTGATFRFLPGNHTFSTTICLRNVSDVTFSGMRGAFVNVISLAEFGPVIDCEMVSNLAIKQLAFFFSGIGVNNTSSFISACNSIVSLIRVAFHGSTGQVALFKNSVATIEGCLFEGITGYYGGAVHSSGTNIILIGNTFVNNTAKHSGGAIYANESSVLLNESTGVNTFSRNSALRNGGALFCTSSRLLITSNATRDEGKDCPPPDNLLYTKQSSFLPPRCAATYFSGNAASNGGALYLENSVASLKGALVTFVNNLAVNTNVFVFSNSKEQMRGGAIYVFGKVQLLFGEGY